MSQQRSIAEAKARFAECVATAEAGNPVVITRHGKPVAVLLPATDLALVDRLRNESPEAGLAGLSAWDDLDDWAETVERVARERSPSAPVPPLDDA